MSQKMRGFMGAASEDAVARRQLELAASSLGEELNPLATLSRKQERLLAQLHLFDN